jgi:DNA polymerase elongation subunit (family B)
LADAGMVFIWKSTAAITGVDLVVLEDEVAVLNCFASFVNKVDPGVFTGFNVCKFQLKYLIERMRKLRLNNALCICQLEGSPMRFFHKPYWAGVEVITHPGGLFILPPPVIRPITRTLVLLHASFSVIEVEVSSGGHQMPCL